MAKEKTTIRFWLRDDKADKIGLCPIHLIYQVKSERKYFAIPDLKLYQINWDINQQKAVFRDRNAARPSGIKYGLLLSAKETAEINAKLQGLIKDIADIETRFKLDKKRFNAQIVIDSLKRIKEPLTSKVKKVDPEVNLADFIDRFVQDSKSTHQKGTLKVYSGLANHIRDFETGRGVKISFDNLDLGMLRRFHGYLTEPKIRMSKKGSEYEGGMNNVTAAKQMSTLKTLVNYARTIYRIKANLDYRDFKISRKDSEFEVITLTNDELMTIYNFDFSDNPRLDGVRDIFCFSCTTGLRYSDLVQLRRDHIKKDDTIRMTAEKTGQKLVIPLNPISHAILQKYSSKLRPLPIISNQKTNQYIKEIGRLVGINAPVEKIRMKGSIKTQKSLPKYQFLSIHVGRKSFITLSLEKGIAIQEVMSLSGHTTFKSFRRYIDVSESRKKMVMASAWGAINPLKVAT